MSRWSIFLLILLPFRAFTQDATIWLNKAARAEAVFKEEEAFAAYKQALRLQPKNVAVLCRCSDLSCRIGNRQANREQKIADFKEGYRYALMAYALDSTNSDVNIVMAFSLGRMTLIQSGKEKVAAAVDIKRYAEQAIRYDPTSYKAYHILGRWQYEVSKLNFLERAFARWFFGALPEASLQEAIREYEKSMSLRPDFMLNYLELAKALHRDGQDARAIQLLRHMATLSDQMYDDRQVRAEGARLMSDLLP